MTTPCFTLRIRATDLPSVTIHAYDDNSGHGTHARIDIEVRSCGEAVFPRGMLYVGIPQHHATDGNYAKRAVLSCVAMKPGDTDSEYFEPYNTYQLNWADRYGDILNYEALRRYGEE